MKIVAEMWSEIQSNLFSYLTECLNGPLTEKLRQVISVLEVVRVEEYISRCYRQRYGRPLCDRRILARAFVAKAVYNLPTTLLLIDMVQSQPSLRRVLGWERVRDIPDEATFSRAFAEFAALGLGDIVHAGLVSTHVGSQIVMHVSLDSTEIDARERPLKKAKAEPKVPRKRGRPGKNEVREPVEGRRILRQMTQTPEAAFFELPKLCDWGTKKNSHGSYHRWKGWKAHILWGDDNIPLRVITTSASLHDSQVAIPLIRDTAQQVTWCYDLMDSAYDAEEIHQVSRSCGHAPIIDIHPRRKNAPPFDPPTAHRYKERTTAERGNSRLKDEFSGCTLRVRGHAKAHMHIMFGILALFADQIMKPMTC